MSIGLFRTDCDDGGFMDDCESERFGGSVIREEGFIFHVLTGFFS